MVLSQWTKAVLLFGLLGGLCLPAQANTTVPEAINIRATARETSATIAQSNLAAPVPGNTAAAQRTVSIALLLPLRSETLGEAADVVRAGFHAAHEHERDNITISIIETGDSAQDTLSAYKAVGAQHDIIVGPLSRTGVTAVAQSGAVSKPTIALTAPDNLGSADTVPPPHMLVMGLSIEEEARQVADWAATERPAKKAVVLFTRTAWQRRAAKAFEMQWQQHGFEVEAVELPANDGFLNGRTLMQLKKDMPSDTSPIFFLALDARQARQVRAIMGKDIVLYGTSQLNPFSLSDNDPVERAVEMDGTRLLDIPWQLQADHPAVMVYPRLVVSPDQKRNADLERLYALGIDAYRVARQIASQQTSFQLDGVTGKLTVRFDKTHAHFERIAQQAVYRDGVVVSTVSAR